MAPWVNSSPVSSATARTGLQDYRHVHWRFADFFGAWSLAKREPALSKLAAGTLGLLTAGPLGEGCGLALALSSQTVHLTAQFLIAVSQVGYLLLQHRNLALQLSHQGQQFLSAQRGDVFKRTHTVKCSQLAPGSQPCQRDRYSTTILQ